MRLNGNLAYPLREKLHHSQFTDLIGCLKHDGKGMWFECEQPFLSGERCVTPRKTAAKKTTYNPTGPSFGGCAGVGICVPEASEDP